MSATPSPLAVEEIAAKAAQLAPLRAVAARVLAMAEDERTAPPDLANAISADPALTAKLLTLANSAYYGFSRRITTVREAVILLGMRSVRSLVVASGVVDAFPVSQTEGFSQDLFWAHSVCAGLAGEAIARAGGSVRAEDAFTAGVLHDIGRLALQRCEPAAFARSVRLVNVEGLRPDDAERAEFGFDHGDVGAALAQHWHFPAPLVAAIRDHGRPLAELPAGSLEAVVAAGARACDAAGLGCGVDWTGDVDRRARYASTALPPALATPEAMTALQERARAFLLHVTGRVPTWYATALRAADDDAEEDAGAA